MRWGCDAIRIAIGIAVLLLGNSSRAATGNVTGEIDTNGVLIVWIEGMGTNLALINGFNSLDIPDVGAATIPAYQSYVVCESVGSLSNGTATTYLRTNHLTKLWRRPYPDQVMNDVFSTGAGCRARAYLSDPVCSGDANPKLYTTALTFAFTNASGVATNYAAPCYGIDLTNNSILPWPQCGANPTWPGWDGSTNNYRRVRAAGTGWVPADWRQRQPLACMAITNYTPFETNGWIVPEMFIDTSLRESRFAKPTPEYRLDYWQTNYTDTNLIVSEITAIPWIGTHRYKLWVTNYCNRTGKFGHGLVAVVDPVTGNGTNGTLGVGNIHPRNLTPFSTADAALWRIGQSNAALWTVPHFDCANSTVFLSSNVTVFSGGTNNAGTNGWAWAELTAYPKHTVRLTTRSGNQFTGRPLKLSNLEIATTTGDVLFSLMNDLWSSNCVHTATGTGPFGQITNWWVTQGRASNFNQGFIATAGGPALNTRLVRGVNLDGFSRIVHAAIMTGCRQWITNGCHVTHDDTGVGGRIFQYPMICNNELLGFNGGGSYVKLGSVYGITNGAAVFNNAFGVYDVTADGATAFFITSETANHTNFLCFNNTFTGARGPGYAYNSVGSISYWRIVCMFRNCIVEVLGSKTDTWAEDPDGGRCGNWSVFFGVCMSGNLFVEVDEITGAGSTYWDQGFCGGINSYWPVTPRGYTFPEYAVRRTWPVLTAGGGDYRPTWTSPARKVPQTRILPYDLNGELRTDANDAAGAYVIAQTNRVGTVLGVGTVNATSVRSQ